MRAHALRRHVLRRFDLEPQGLAIKTQRRVKIADGDPDMVESDGVRATSWRDLQVARARTSKCARRDLLHHAVWIGFARGNRVEDARELARRENLPLDVLHETIGEQLPDAE